jgi:hypothetical protein
MSVRNSLRAAISGRDSIKAEIGATRAKAADLLAAADTAEAEAAEVELAALDLEASALVSGIDKPGQAGDEERQIDRLRKKARAATRAAEVESASIGQLEGRLAEAELATSEAALTAFRAERDEARAAALEVIASLVPFMARLVAADRVRRTLVGDRYHLNATRHPPIELWSGEIVARAFAKSVPDRLRPEAFAETIEAAAEKMATEALASLKGSPK